MEPAHFLAENIETTYCKVCNLAARHRMLILGPFNLLVSVVKLFSLRSMSCFKHGDQTIDSAKGLW